MATSLLRRPLRLPRLSPRIIPFATRGYAVETPAPGKRTAVYHEGQTVEDRQAHSPEALLAETGDMRKDVAMKHFTGLCNVYCLFGRFR